MKRRNFIKSTTAVIASGTLLGSSEALAQNQKSPVKSSKIKTILFQGDSITDAGRERSTAEANHPKALGRGYAFLAAGRLLAEYPELMPKIYNRGISGNKVFQLAERWQAEAIDLKPDVVSILIGVNDHWHTLSGKYDGNPQVYHNDLKALLTRTKDELGDVKLIIGEPFILEGGTAIDLKKWVPTFHEYQDSARTLAKSFQAEFIPYQSIFNKAMKSAPVSYWAPDGVHPSLAGAQLMANHWIQAFKKCV